MNERAAPLLPLIEPEDPEAVVPLVEPVLPLPVVLPVEPLPVVEPPLVDPPIVVPPEVLPLVEPLPDPLPMLAFTRMKLPPLVEPEAVEPVVPDVPVVPLVPLVPVAPLDPDCEPLIRHPVTTTVRPWSLLDDDEPLVVCCALPVATARVSAIIVPKRYVRFINCLQYVCCLES